MVYSGVNEQGDDILINIFHPEGVVSAENGRYTYQYHLTDYMGNVRSVAEADNNSRSLLQVQATDYYPFGLAHSYNDLHRNRYLFSGKELQDQALGKSGFLGLYDFGARYYNPMLGRWFNTDPASQYTNPYLFCGNAPMAYIDKDGRCAWLVVGIGALVGAYFGGASANDNWNPFQWDWSSPRTLAGFFGGAMQGGVAAGLGAFVGSAVGAYLPQATTLGSFIGNGAAIGASSGFAGGFVNGGLNAAMNSGNILESALLGGSIGAFTGGMTGAIGGGINYGHLKRGFARVDAAVGRSSLSTLTPSNATLKEFDELYFNGYKYRQEARLVYDPLMTENLAITSPLRINGLYEINFATGAFQDKLTLYLTMGHEYVYVGQLVSELPLSKSLIEAGAYHWERTALANSGMQKSWNYNSATSFYEQYLRAYGNSTKALSQMRYYDNSASWGLPQTFPKALR